jgi:hypothetical protein
MRADWHVKTPSTLAKLQRCCLSQAGQRRLTKSSSKALLTPKGGRILYHPYTHNPVL